MQILRIAYKEIKVGFRDARTFVFMLAFPIVLMLILGTALTNAFTVGLDVDDMRLLYRNTATSEQLRSGWDEFAAAIGREGVELTPAPPEVDGRVEVSEDRYTAYAEIGDDGIAYYGGVRHTLESNVLQGMLATFADRYNLAAAAASGAPERAAAIMAAAGAGGEYIRETALDPAKRPNSMDYYAIAMTVMIAFYACLPASNLIRGERLRNTSVRLAAAPISKGTIFAGKVLGGTVENFVCVIAVVLFSEFVFGANWGGHYVPVLLVLLTEVMLAISVGLCFSYLFRDSGQSIAMIVTQIISFLGGAYFPVDGNGFLASVVYLSPMHWAIQGLTQLIYANDGQAALTAIALNAGVAVAFLAIAAVLMRRREAL